MDEEQLRANATANSHLFLFILIIYNNKKVTNVYTSRYLAYKLIGDTTKTDNIHKILQIIHQLHILATSSQTHMLATS